MKSIITLSILIQFGIFTLFSPAVFSSNKNGEKEKPGFVLTAAQKQASSDPGHSQILEKQFLNIGDNLAWGLNTWTHQLFSLDVSSPGEIFIFDTLDFQSLAGSFGSNDTELFYLIQYPENIVKTVNVLSGEISTVGDLPAPMADGIWTSLSVQAASGIFYGIATDGIESVLYEINIYDETSVEVLNLGLPAVISSALDGDGNMYFFDIENDSTYVANIQAGTITALGAAGFDGNYAQGMAYSSADDEIYLAAYVDLVGAQLRKLDRTSGETTFIANLPGETAAFSFRNEKPIPSGIDFGDAPEQAGNPFSFPTTLANNGAAHTIDPTVFLGEKIDGEADGQPDANALGDDNDIFYPSAGDDEDGIILPTSAAPGTQVIFTAKASVDGYLDAWMDFDHDQTWLNPSEHIFDVQPLTAGTNSLTFMVPPTAATGQTILRFRFRSSPVPLSFGGMASDGEVEDYTILLKENNGESMDYGDAPDGFNNKHYKTTWVNDGARHKIVDGVFLGVKVDAEIDGQPSTAALGDDNDLFFPAAGDDEDGVELPTSLTSGASASITVMASTDGYIDAWLDCDLNGDWGAANEHLLDAYPLNAGSNSISLNIPADADAGVSYLRFRFRDNAAPLTWYGYTKGGEVEDYRIQIVKAAGAEFDFGDAPEGFGTGLFPVTLANNGAHHLIVPGVYLGASVDAEPDGQPSIGATGDDTDMIYPSNGDDEDGISFPGALIIGATSSITVLANVDGFLSAWIDFDGDGYWNTNEEQVFDLTSLAAGINTLTFAVPDSATAGLAYGRFRFQDTESPLSFDGLAQSGEVEDYAIQILEDASTGQDFGDAPDALYPTSLNRDGARHINNGTLFLGSLIDTEADGISSLNAKGDDLNYLDDEDGISFQNPLIIGRTAYIQVVASANALLNAWIDLNDGNGWAGDAAHIFADYFIEAGSHSLSFDIPDEAMAGQTFLRFRLSSQTGLSFTGEATDGEVEDYQSAIYPDWLAQPTQLVHTISIPAGLPPLQTGDLLGLFFMDNDGKQKPAGSLVVSQGQFNQILAYGDDPATPQVKEGFAVGETLNWKLFEPETAEARNLAVVYDSTFPDYQGTFRPFGFSALSQANYQQNPCSMPTDWEFAITGTTHNINIPLAVAPEVFGAPLMAGDWIGVFYKDDNDEQKCGGAIQWNDVAGVVLTAFGDDPATGEKDGFAPGEAFQWKLYACESTEVFPALATYNSNLPCQGEFGSFCLSEIDGLQATRVQSISLQSGWNSISTFLVPSNPEVENIFAPYADNLTIIQNLTTFYWPYADINTIGNWDTESGYALKVSADVNMEIYGTDLAPQELALSPGWHYLPVLSSCPVDADELLSPVMEKITLVQDIIGTEVWWPAMGVFSLQTLVPGKAYKIRVEESLNLTFAPCNNFKTIMEKAQQSNQSKTPWGELIQTPGSHTIAISSSAISGLSPGDCLGAFGADGNLYGFLEIENTSENSVMMVYGDDVTTGTKDGFYENEAITFGVLEKATGNEIPLELTFDHSMPNPEQVFNNQGLSAVTGSTLSGFQTPSASRELSIYPNPSTGILNIDGLPENTRLSVFNTFGKVIMKNEVSTSVEINLTDQAKGVYFIRIESEGRSYFEKLILN